jgi:two-component system sensor histidine kinase UhpB
MLDRLTRLRDETSGRVLQAQELERRRLALELHDQTGQSLTALSLHITAIAARLDGDTSEAAVQARAQLGRLNTLAQSTLRDVQALARQLRPSLLDDVGLVAALRWLAQDGSERLGMQVSVRLGGAAVTVAHQLRALPRSALLPAEESDGDGGLEAAEAARLPTEIETALFRIAQESLTNAVRHGRASRVALLLRQMPSQVSLLIADDGRGFNVRQEQERQRPGEERRGMGLEGMSERARLVGGHLAIRSRPGRGCAVRVSIPLSNVPGAARPDMVSHERQRALDVEGAHHMAHADANAPAAAESAN